MHMLLIFDHNRLRGIYKVRWKYKVSDVYVRSRGVCWKRWMDPWNYGPSPNKAIGECVLQSHLTSTTTYVH